MIGRQALYDIVRLLVTGFEPFRNYKENSSWAVAEKVAACSVEGVEVITCLLPVSFAGVASALRKAVEESGTAAKVSNSAGLYVCNRLYYEALQLCNERPGMKALFVHLPFYDGQPSATAGQPKMPIDKMVKAVRIIISNMMQKEELSNIQ